MDKIHRVNYGNTRIKTPTLIFLVSNYITIHAKMIVNELLLLLFVSYYEYFSVIIEIILLQCINLNVVVAWHSIEL